MQPLRSNCPDIRGRLRPAGLSASVQRVWSLAEKTKRMGERRLCDVHKFRGAHVSYALKCAGDEEARFCVYVGSTSDIEQRMMDHARGRAAKYTARHPPTGEILHIREHDTAREALLAEVALWNLWAGKIGYDRVRGARWNMPGPMPFAPREWRKKCEAQADFRDDEKEECPDFWSCAAEPNLSPRSLSPEAGRP